MHSELNLGSEIVVMSLASSFVDGDSDNFMQLYDCINEDSTYLLERVRNLIDNSQDQDTSLSHSNSEDTLYSLENKGSLMRFDTFLYSRP